MSDWKVVEAKPLTESSVWNPEVGAVCEGVLTELKKDLGPNKSTLLTIEDAMGNPTSMWENAVLADRLADVEVGAEVRIKFLGKVMGKSGRSYNNYEVAVKA